MKLLVYIVTISEHVSGDPTEMNDNDFANEARRQENVRTLVDFQNEFNEGSITPGDCFIRILPDTFYGKKDEYYQPVLTVREMIENDFYSFQVYRHKENAEKDFPGKEIRMYTGDDIEEPTFVDDDGTNGQNRENYTDEQDRENYTI